MSVAAPANSASESVRTSPSGGTAPARSSEIEQRLSAIDPFRGAAALAVLLFHANQAIWRHDYLEVWNGETAALGARSLPQIATYLLCGFGFLGVHLFFVISGFCIHLPFAGNAKPMPKSAWLVRRLVRLYPAYFAAFNLAFLLVAFQKGAGHGGATLANYIGHLFFWYYWVGPDGSDLGIIPVLWTIGIEIHLYLLYIVLLPLMRRVGIGRVTLAALAFELAYRFFWESVDWGGWPVLSLAIAPRRFVLARLGEWLLGAWVAEAYVRKSSIRVSGGWIAALFVGTIALVAASGVREWWLDVPMATAFALWLSSRVSDGAYVTASRWLDAAFSKSGEYSYSLYLTHVLVIAGVFEIWSRLSHASKDAVAGQPIAYLIALSGCAAALVCGYLFYLIFEKPSHGAAKRIYRQMVTPRTPAVAGAPASV